MILILFHDTKKTGPSFHIKTMPFHLSSRKPGSKLSRLSILVLAYFLFSFCSGLVVEADSSVTNIGAIIDVDSRVGKEQKTAMTLAVQNFNNNSRNHRLNIYFKNTSKYPVQAVSTAKELIGKKKVQVIIGTQTWEEAALAAHVGKPAQVPVLSLAAPSSIPLLTQNRWPFLVQMATDSLEQINCIAAIVSSCHWRKVIAIHEDNSYFADSGLLPTLSEAIQNVGASIEYDLILPPFSSLSDPEGFVRQEVAKLLRKQSRVFIVLHSSLTLAKHLFREAKQIGLMGRDSVWILTDSISDLLDSVDPNLVSSTQGAIGIKSYYSERNRHVLNFKDQFRMNFGLQYPDEDNWDLGIHALKAYDSIAAIAEAVKRLGGYNTSNPKLLLNEVLSNNFAGLSGEIRFHGGELKQKPVYKIVNIVGRSYKELGNWSSKFNFSERHVEEGSGVIGFDNMNNMLSLVTWPGDLDRVPKGWAVPTDIAPMRIGVPQDDSFPEFVMVKRDKKTNKTTYDGFCIDIFEEVIKILDYPLHYEFMPFDGSFSELVGNVSNKNFDAAVGDVTILAERSRIVEFTQPFRESGVSMIVPVKIEPQMAWIFMKPFTRNLWMVTLAILFYTSFVVWFIEHPSNEEFKGTWKHQLGTAMWFTFSSLFFAHREEIERKYTKLVVVIWLFVVLVLTSSYEASLTSMLTVPRLEPTVTSIDSIRKTNATVGCDGDSFVEDYLRNIIKLQNIKTISSRESYSEAFKNGSIAAAFLELPYRKIFLKDHCKEYIVTGPTYSFGGLGFVSIP
ncbi:glutamate receptor -like [Olea europaea subsp. europaea]|uniref:Glutamate receptor n=1 Tax=Olea europaea subsp. europaea TaxID=158383 RepID=A0A8S0PN14_OLEEU|nr:glutamate receptor -like [Olea europaea subsp. europaea]